MVAVLHQHWVLIDTQSSDSNILSEMEMCGFGTSLVINSSKKKSKKPSYSKTEIHYIQAKLNLIEHRIARLSECMVWIAIVGRLLLDNWTNCVQLNNCQLFTPKNSFQINWHLFSHMKLRLIKYAHICIHYKPKTQSLDDVRIKTFIHSKNTLTVRKRHLQNKLMAFLYCLPKKIPQTIIIFSFFFVDIFQYKI